MTDVLGSRLTPLEIASGVVLGQVTDPVADPAHGKVADPAGNGVAAPADSAGVTRPAGRAQKPLAALEAAVLPALQQQPCLVSFSGGLDSSLILAVAVRAARRAGLAPPIPVTWRFTGAHRADESAWQERIIRAVGSQSWQILHADDDLDLVGPVARRLARGHGLAHPANLHLHLPIVELAAGGAMLTGAGGDQVLAGWHRPLPWRRSLRRQASLARSVLMNRPPRTDLFPWLHPEISRLVERDYRAEIRREPRRLGERIGWHTGRRDLALTCSGLASIAAGHAVKLVNPLLDAGFLAALIAHAGQRPGLRRDELLAEITRGELAAVITAPRAKARFLEVFHRSPTQQFTSGWDGTGADETLVDVAALRNLWSAWPIPPGTSTLVQHLWLAADASGRAAKSPRRPTAASEEHP